MNTGIDILRIIALVLVTWQHAASVFGYYADTQWHGVSPGQTGVAIFCAISGYLAFHARPESVTQWFKKRLTKIFPAYWLVTIGAFFLTAITSSKDFSGWLLISQMLGLGYFTHGWELINVVSWFISLILLCYILAAICWKNRSPDYLLILFTLLAVLSCGLRLEVVMSRHVIAFCLGGYLAFSNRYFFIFLVVIGLTVVGVNIDPQFFYSGTSLVFILAAIKWKLQYSKIIQYASNYSYEYFLVHGIFLVGVSKIISQTYIAFVLALTGSIVAAILVRHLSSFGVHLAERVLGPTR